MPLINCRMVGEAFIQLAGTDTLLDQSTVNAAAFQIGNNAGIAVTFGRQEQRFRLLRLSAGMKNGRSFRRPSHDPLYRLGKRELFDLDQVIQRCFPADPA